MIVVDFETRSLCPLRKTGGRIYAAHPTTVPLCASLWIDGRRVDWIPGEPCPVPANPGEVLAHNAIGFDRHVWARLGWPEPSRWIDSAELARVGGFPRADLDGLAQRLLGRTKDKEGNRLTIGLSHPARYHKPIPPETLARVVQYCGQDVDDTVAFLPHLIGFDGTEPDVQAADRAIIDRGIAFDRPLAEALILADRVNAENAVDVAKTTAKAVRSNPQLLALFAELGVDLANCRRDTIEKLFDHEDDSVRLLARARFASVPIAAKKLQTALIRLSPDDRLRDSVRYQAAHTGRWGGAGFQPQNLPRGVKLPPETADQILAGDWSVFDRHDPVHVISTLARQCLVARGGHVLSVIDYGQIEARVIAWCAGDEHALGVFRAYDEKRGPDPYRVMGGIIAGVDGASLGPTSVWRQIGKIAVLALSYAMGAKKFGITAEASPGFPGWDAIAPVTPQGVVDAWRSAHHGIVAWWHDLQRAMTAVVMHGAQIDRAGPVTFHRAGADVYAELPSGRCIVYRDVDAVRGRYGWSITYASRRGREHLYGGKIAENAVQAISRCILAAALVRCEQLHMPTVLHVHDEIVIETPADGADRAHRAHHAAMVERPAWGRDIPIVAEGYVSKRYRK